MTMNKSNQDFVSAVTRWRNETKEVFTRNAEEFDREMSKVLTKMEALVYENEHKQFLIDNLMLEFCPDEITKEQIENWGNHQRRANAKSIDIESDS